MDEDAAWFDSPRVSSPPRPQRNSDADDDSSCLKRSANRLQYTGVYTFLYISMILLNGLLIGWGLYFVLKHRCASACFPLFRPSSLFLFFLLSFLSPRTRLATEPAYSPRSPRTDCRRRYTLTLIVCDIVLTSFFVIEVAVRLSAKGAAFFRSWANVMDILLACAAIFFVASYAVRVQETFFGSIILLLRYAVQTVRLIALIYQ